MTQRSDEPGRLRDPDTEVLESGPGAPLRNVGPYRLLERVGAGGMGEVWLAEQETPRRKVAVKLIRPGLVTRELVARFEAERQALALMSHPNVARVYDAGEADGVPYFVMEYVPGLELTHYCDHHALPLDRRLRLFVQVCDGVQHAHQKGLVHRDLKSSNVLVHEVDGVATPKIIDFGVAKATQQPLTQRTLHTEAGALIGTPEYMAPEQFESEKLDVDTRADVYALGVLLYELLCGERPFERPDGGIAALINLRRRILDEDAPLPSTRLASAVADAAARARRRGVERSILRRRLQGDLDWVVAKALEKNRERRYQTALELGSDVRRSLAHEPVSARPPSVSYRASRFVRRHRIGVASAAGAVLLLIAAVVGTSWGLLQARREAERAQREARTSDEVSEFLVDLFETVNPESEPRPDIEAREILDRGVVRMRTDLADQPEVLARLLATVGSTYQGLGLYDQASELLDDAVELRRRLGAGDVELADVLVRLGDVQRERGEMEASRQLLEEGVRRLEASAPESEELAEALHILAAARADGGEPDRAQELFERSLALRQRLYETDDLRIAQSLNSLGVVRADLGAYDEAIGHFERALQIKRRQLPDDHPSIAASLVNLATALNGLDRGPEAEALLLEALAIEQVSKGADHPDVGALHNNLGSILERMGRLDEAETHLRRGLEVWTAALGAEHPDVGIALHNLGNLKRASGDHQEALDHYRRSYAIWRAALGPEHFYLAISRAEMAQSLQRLGRRDEAAEALRQSLEVAETSLGPDNPRTVEIRTKLAEAMGE